MDAKQRTTRLRWYARWPLAGAALAMACGGTMAARPSALSVARATPPDWNAMAWFRARPCYTEAERAEVWDRFDPAKQMARDDAPAAAPPPSRGWAIADIQPAGRWSRARHGGGVVQFEADRRQVVMRAKLTGLQPGEHAFTIHDAGSCAELRGGSAAHFNPTHGEHGAIDSRARHAGDVGNVTADASGNATLVLLTDSFQLSGDGSIVGKTIVIHARRDDGKTQPSGNSGPPVACGVVRLSGDQVAIGD